MQDRVRFIDRIQILSGEVFNDRRLERFGVVKLMDDYRHLGEVQLLGSQEAPLPSDEFITPSSRPYQQGLLHALLANTGFEQLEGVRVDLFARLLGVGIDKLGKNARYSRLLPCPTRA